MWRISYKTMSLQDVLIMAYMNVLQARLGDGLYSLELTWIMGTTTI
jgi:hypothetical protein